MQERIYNSQAIGLEWNGARLKAALLTFNKGISQIESLSFFPIEEQKEHGPNPLLLTEEGQSFLRKAGKGVIVSLLNADEALVRQLEIQLKKEKDIDAVLAFQAEPLLPYPIENAILDRVVLSKSKDGTLLSLLSVRKDHLQQHLERWKSLEIEPEIVSCVPAALTAFSKKVMENGAGHLIIHISFGGTCCAYIKDSKLLMAQSSNYSLQNLKEALGKDLKFEDPEALSTAFKNLDWLNVSPTELPLLKNTLDNYRLDLARTVLSLAKQTEDLKVPNILITGDVIEYPMLATVLSQDLGTQIPISNSAFGSQISTDKMKLYAVPIGAALMALPKYPDQVNFRQQEFSYPHPWKHLIRPFALYIASSLLLAAALYTFGEAYLGSKADEVRSEYSQLLTIMNKPFTDFEREITKTPTTARGRGQPTTPTIHSLSLDDIQSRLQILDKEIRSVPDIFPLMPNVPLVSDVLAWISSHPNAVSKNSETNKTSPLITIENFSYTMVKRPEMTKKQEKYQVKVELEFTTTNPTIAREFHDALIAPNDFIDPKGDVKWSTSKGKYKAIFYLKDKTTYSSGGS